MLYIWTHDINRSEESFWKSSLRKFDALYREDLKVNGLLKDEETVYINEIF